MKVCFFRSDKPREGILADAFCDGVRAHGDEAFILPLTPDIKIAPADVACMVGVKSRELYQAHVDAGINVVYLDKGYHRHAADLAVKVWEYWRVSLNSHHPTQFLSRLTLPSDRSEQMEILMQPWRKRGDHIVIAGSSAKYHSFYGLHDPTRWAHKLVKDIQHASTRPIVYRPKPSWREAVPIEGTRFSSGFETIEEVLENAWLLITHGSNAVFEAVCSGIPCIVLGDAVARPISDTEVTPATLDKPLCATYAQRNQWAANLAYWQWSMPEMHSGQMWRFLRPLLYG